jgi:hypothetical protein
LGYYLALALEVLTRFRVMDYLLMLARYCVLDLLIAFGTLPVFG